MEMELGVFIPNLIYVKNMLMISFFSLLFHVTVAYIFVLVDKQGCDPYLGSHRVKQMAHHFILIASSRTWTIGHCFLFDDGFTFR